MKKHPIGIKKFLAALIAILMLLSLSVSGFAAGGANGSVVTTADIETCIEKHYGFLMRHFLEHSEIYGVELADPSELSLLSPVAFRNAEGGGSNAQVVYLPVVDGTNQVAAIFTVMKENGRISATLGTDFAPLLNQAIDQNELEVLLLQDGNTLLAVSAEGDVFTLHGRNTGPNSAYRSPIESSMLSFDLDSDEAVLRLGEINEPFTALADNALREQEEQDRESNTLRSSPAITGENYLSNYRPYDIVDQNVDGRQHGLCWAAVVASMCRYEKPDTWGTLTAQNVADYMGIGYDDGGTNNEAKSALEHYRGSPYVPTIKNVLSQADIITVINNIDPAYLQCRRPNGFLRYEYHAVALTGYLFSDTQTAVQIMDPAYECFKLASYNGSNWTFPFGTYTYTWIKTIRLLYNV